MSKPGTVLFALIASALPALSAPVAEGPLHIFAACAGRLSATMEHQWLMRDPAAERTEAQRSAMVALVDAVMVPDRAPDVLGWRIDAKRAHAVLLTRATFNADDDDASWALARAETELAACTGLLLS